MSEQPPFESDAALPPAAAGVWRLVYVGAGLFFVALGVVGMVVPVLPTTPFLLLALGLFARSSPRLHAWLLRSRLFGPILRDWHKHRGVRPRVKVVTLTMLPAVVFSSAYLGQLNEYLFLMLLAFAGIGAFVVLRLKTVRDE